MPGLKVTSLFAAEHPASEGTLWPVRPEIERGAYAAGVTSPGSSPSLFASTPHPGSVQVKPVPEQPPRALIDPVVRSAAVTMTGPALDESATIFELENTLPVTFHDAV